MLTPTNRWAPRGAAFALAALAAASAAYWGLKLGAGAAPLLPPAGAAAPPAADPAAVARLLGAGPVVSAASPVASPSSRFSLVGVVSAASHDGAALIAVDGKPAKPFRVGSRVDEGLMLQSVEPRRAVLAADAKGPAVVTLEMPAFRK